MEDTNEQIATRAGNCVDAGAIATDSWKGRVSFVREVLRHPVHPRPPALLPKVWHSSTVREDI